MLTKKFFTVRHGITNEPHAVKRYKSVLQSLRHDIQTFYCGILVDPQSPWLGASPDRLVFDPTETSPHGVLEVKCPYSAFHSVSPDVDGLCMGKDSAGVYRLKREHAYYFQVLGQMALSGCEWADFVVYTKNYMIAERIRFDITEWEACKKELDKFYFRTYLPYLVRLSLSS